MEQLKGCLGKKALSDFWLIVRLSLQIALYSLLKHKESDITSTLFFAPQYIT